MGCGCGGGGLHVVKCEVNSYKKSAALGKWNKTATKETLLDAEISR